MSDIIQLLPDAVANQIAAGEVIQRPASVIKEIVENSIDAGSSEITILVKDAGRTSIQVIDNGFGMSETDARLSFERHATSKIKAASDLFCIQTKGFRGEALASIAAIADVELKTKNNDSELGTFIHIKGSEVVRQEHIACETGSNFLIRNLFYNVPARRKFLKKNTTELRHIINEFQRVALAHTEIHFILNHNDTELYNLPSANLRQRIVHVFGKNMNQNLIDIDISTTLINIKGFIGKPEHARKTYGEQYFFVNHRYMKHPYFHKAIMSTYEKLLALDSIPSYFLFLEINPESIDINIHPTKTEIKFENEFAIFQIIQASVKEALGKFNIVPSIDFNTDGMINIPIPHRNQYAKLPEIDFNKDFNPFNMEQNSSANRPKSFDSANFHKEPVDSNWTNAYEGLKNTESIEEESLFSRQAENVERQIFQFKNKYIMLPVKSGLMLIHQRRAHERILYEKFIQVIQNSEQTVQQQLFPIELELNTEEYSILLAILKDLNQIGFELNDIGKNTINITAIPAFLEDVSIEEIMDRFIEEFKSETFSVEHFSKENLARMLSKSACIKSGMRMNSFELQQIVDELFACSSPNYTIDNKLIISILNADKIENLFN